VPSIPRAVELLGDQPSVPSQNGVRFGNASNLPKIALIPIPVNELDCWGPVLRRTPAWSWPRSRRSACFPAEAYPPLRSFVMYPREQVCARWKEKIA
jgi:hypothetical protein